METEQDVHDAIHDAIRQHADPALAGALYTMNATVAGYPDGVRGLVLEGFTAGILAHVSPDFTARCWLAGQAITLNVQAGMLALRETQETLDRVQALEPAC